MMDCEGEILSRQVNGVIYHYECCNLLASHMFFSLLSFRSVEPSAIMSLLYQLASSFFFHFFLTFELYF